MAVIYVNYCKILSGKNGGIVFNTVHEKVVM
jgi:hypothetical protein